MRVLMSENNLWAPVRQYCINAAISQLFDTLAKMPDDYFYIYKLIRFAQKQPILCFIIQVSHNAIEYDLVILAFSPIKEKSE